MGNLGECGIGDVSQKRRRFSKISRWGSFETSCALAGNLWKNEMRRISGPSTSIFGRKFTEVIVCPPSNQFPLRRIHFSVHNGICAAGVDNRRLSQGRDQNRRILFEKNRGRWLRYDGIFSHIYPHLMRGRLYVLRLHYEKSLIAVERAREIVRKACWKIVIGISIQLFVQTFVC